MDYLAGKQINVSHGRKEDSVIRSQQRDSIFYSICSSLLKCLNLDEQAGVCEKYLTSEIISVMEDKELVECINAFFKNNLNISETSRNAFLHRNTLLYRIEKINKLTGLNIRNFEDAMSFRMLTIIYEKTAEKMGKKK